MERCRYKPLILAIHRLIPCISLLLNIILCINAFPYVSTQSLKLHNAIFFSWFSNGFSEPGRYDFQESQLFVYI